MPAARRNGTPYFRNLLAILVAALGVGILHLNVDPMETGGQPMARAASIDGPMLRIPPSPSLPEKLSTSKDEKAGEEEGQQAPDLAFADDPNVLRGIWAVKMASELLSRGCDSFGKVPDYTSVMFKQERINGLLSDMQTIDLKIRHEPFSVYMKWSTGDKGRQLIYVDGQNEGHMLVQPGGLKGRLTGVMSLDPNGSLAMSESRYPITKAGLLELAQTILEYQQADIARGTGFTCELRDHQTFDERDCFLYIIEYASPEVNDVYRKSIVYIDKEFSMPVCAKNYTWARDANPETIDEETLVEFYAYTDLRMQRQLGAVDFDQHNSDYRLRVRR